MKGQEASPQRHIRHDPALGMVAGAFRPLGKGARSKLDVQMAWKDATIRWRGPDQLGIGDQSVLFAVLEVALQQWRDAGREAVVTEDDALWELLVHQRHVFKPELLRVVTSFRRLAQLCGYGDSGVELNLVRESLRRLAETTVWVRRGNFEGSSHLLGWQLGDQQQVALVLNWRFTQALQGVPYSRISMEERAQMSSEPAKALHAVLSCKVDPGAAWSCELEDLQGYVWGDLAGEGSKRRKRHARLREVLAEVHRLPGWAASVSADKVHITRGSAAFRSGDGGRSAPPVVSGTPRRNRDETPEYQARLEQEESSNGAGFQLVDASVLLLL